MLKPSDDDTTTALARLAKTAEWEKVEKWLLRCREDFVRASLSPDTATSRQAQGQFMVIDELLKQARAAVESATSR